jgi:hypothetical protein
VARTRRFIESPALYDAIYHFKNYARESDRLSALINEAAPLPTLMELTLSATAINRAIAKDQSCVLRL